MAELLEKRYKTTLRYAADLRTALEGVVKVWEEHRAEPRTVRDWRTATITNKASYVRDLDEAMHYAEEILKQMEVHEQIREISNE